MEKQLEDLIETFSDVLREIGVHPVDINLFVHHVYGKTENYSSFDELKRDIINKKIKVYFTVDALFDEVVWENV